MANVTKTAEVGGRSMHEVIVVRLVAKSVATALLLTR